MKNFLAIALLPALLIACSSKKSDPNADASKAQNVRGTAPADKVVDPNLQNKADAEAEITAPKNFAETIRDFEVNFLNPKDVNLKLKMLDVTTLPNANNPQAKPQIVDVELSGEAKYNASEVLVAELTNAKMPYLTATLTCAKGDELCKQVSVEVRVKQKEGEDTANLSLIKKTASLYTVDLNKEKQGTKLKNPGHIADALAESKLDLTVSIRSVQDTTTTFFDAEFEVKKDENDDSKRLAIIRGKVGTKKTLDILFVVDGKKSDITQAKADVTYDAAEKGSLKIDFHEELLLKTLNISF